MRIKNFLKDTAALWILALVIGVGLAVPAHPQIQQGGSTGGSGTIAIPATVSGATSGGIPCFDSGTDMNTSAAITANHLIIGGGAGACAADSGVVSTSGVLSSVAGEAIVPSADSTTVLTVKDHAATNTIVAVDTDNGGNGLVVNAAPGGGFAAVFGATATFSTVRGTSLNLGSSGQGTNSISSTAPTITAAGCGGSAASIPNKNGTASFEVNVGTSNTGTCTITMPAATTNWLCSATDITTTSTNVFVTKAVPGGTPTTQVTLQNYTDVAGTHAWTDSDVIEVNCFGE